MGKDSAEAILFKIAELDALEFLGICRILGVRIYEDSLETYEEEDPIERNRKLEARPFEDIWNDMCDMIWTLNRKRRRTLSRLVRAATQGEK